MESWDGGRTYTIVGSTEGDDLLKPGPYKFKLQPVLGSGEILFYNLVPEKTTGKNVFNKGCVLLPQPGKTLSKRIPAKKRLVEDSDETYRAAVEALMDKIVDQKIDNDPFGYERLVGFVASDTMPVNPVTFYRVKHTHRKKNDKDPNDKGDEKVMLIGFVNLIDTSPGGTIAIIS